jgi:hypothetical protein
MPQKKSKHPSAKNISMKQRKAAILLINQGMSMDYTITNFGVKMSLTDTFLNCSSYDI